MYFLILVNLYVIYIATAIISSFAYEDRGIIKCFPMLIINILFMISLILLLVRGILHI